MTFALPADDLPADRTPDPTRRVAAVALALAVGFCLTPWASPPVALAVGAAIALTVGNPAVRLTHRATKPLLQGSVVLLGFGMDLGAVMRAGADGFLFAAGTIFGTLLLGYGVGRLLGIDRGVGRLISCGTAICGGSAVAAVGAATGAAEGQMTVAMGVVFLLNAAALYLFPAVGHALGLTPHQFGTWAGVGIHDVSSVVGAAATFGPEALRVATAVKLSRALWIVPVAAAAAVGAKRRARAAGAGEVATTLPVPWFIGAFLLASLVRTLVPAVAGVAPLLTHAATVGLTVTLLLVGAGLSPALLRSVGPRVLLLGVVLWAFIAVASLEVVRLTVA